MKKFTFLFFIIISTYSFAQNNCDDKIIRYENWKEAENQEWNFRIKSENGGELFYFGAEHSRDILHPQFGKIKKSFEEFKPTIIFYEGPDRGIANSESEAISTMGESGFIRFLAHKNNLKIARLEPDPQDEAGFVMQSFPKDQVLLFYILREVAQIRERQNLPEEKLKAAAENLIKVINNFENFSGVINSTSELQQSYKKYWNSPENFWEAPIEWFDPLGDGEITGGKFTHDVNRASSYFRDKNMVDVLSEAVLNGEKVFAVVGRNHVPMQIEALKCKLGKD